MGHQIKINNNFIYTDLAIETTILDIKEASQKKKDKEDIIITEVEIKKEVSQKINKNPGLYINIAFEDITDHQNKENLIKALEKEIIKLINKENIKKTDHILVVGLGNQKSTPDALGSLVVENIEVTKHLFDLKLDVLKRYSPLSAFTPGVKGKTGLDTSNTIKGIIKQEKPKLIIAIDALAARSLERVNKTIQLTNTGISPGSGVGNHQTTLTKKTLGIPIIAIGVPTVVSTSTIVCNTIEYINNYLQKEIGIKKTKAALGILSTYNNEQLKELVETIIIPKRYNLIVTTKEIDFEIDAQSKIIARALNGAIHRQNFK